MMPKRSGRQQPRARQRSQMACARPLALGKSPFPIHLVGVAKQPPWRSFTNNGHRLGLRRAKRPSAKPRSEVAEMSITQRTALVTGGNRGLGAAIACALHDAGHRVIVTHTLGNTTVAEWQKAQAERGYTFPAYGVDVSDYDSAQDLAQRIHGDGHR